MSRSRTRHHRRFSMHATASLLSLMLLTTSAAALAQRVPDFIGYCRNCSESAFGHTAEEAAPPVPGTHPVYVLDTGSGEVRFFSVEVWFDPGDGIHPQADEKPEQPPNPPISLQGIHTEAIPGTGDPTVISAMEEAFDIVLDFAQLLYGAPVPASGTSTRSGDGDSSMEDVPIGDLGLDLDSAVELVGPEDSSAGFNRLRLQNEINNFYHSVWGSLTSGLLDVLTRLSNRFLGDGLIDGGQITITFPDDTSVVVKLNSFSPEIGGPAFGMDLDVRTDTVQGPDLSAVPQSPGQFAGFSYGGGEGLVNSLADTAGRFGLSVGPPGSGGTDCVAGCPPQHNCFVSCSKSLD